MYTLRKFVSVACTLALVLFTSVHQSGAQSKPTQDSLEQLFRGSEATALIAATACKSDKCSSLRDQILQHVTAGRELRKSGRWVSAKGEWHKKLGELLLELRAELLLNSPASVTPSACTSMGEMKQKGLTPQCTLNTNNSGFTGHLLLVDDCHDGCDRVYNQAVLICAAYALVSPAASAICMAATLIGYNNCLSKCDAQTEQPPVG